MPDEPTTGATPGAGATPAQAGQQTTTPAATGATPPAGTTAPAADTPPATGDDASLGDTGKRILAEARRAAKEAEDRAKAAEAERDALKASTQTEAEKALAAAVREAERNTAARYEVRIRQSEVRAALTAAGMSATELDLALAAPEFSRLKVGDQGTEGVTDAVAAFKTAHPGLFTARQAPPVADLGGGVRGRPTGGLTLEQIKAMTPEEVAARLPEVNEAMARMGAGH